MTVIRRSFFYESQHSAFFLCYTNYQLCIFKELSSFFPFYVYCLCFTTKFFHLTFIFSLLYCYDNTPFTLTNGYLKLKKKNRLSSFPPWFCNIVSTRPFNVREQFMHGCMFVEMKEIYVTWLKIASEWFFSIDTLNIKCIYGKAFQ